MIRPPFLARVAAGAALSLFEEAANLPSTAMSLPMTTVSRALQTTMRVQQTMTALAIKGDQLFEMLGSKPAETAEWATFDDPPATPTVTKSTLEADGDATPGRYALYSMPPEAAGATPGPSSNGRSRSAGTTATATVALPDIAEEIDYPSLTLAQLRARLRRLDVEALTALLDYENATTQRAPFVTMLSNRITSAGNK